MIKINTLSDLSDLNITVMGLGINGGGLATALFLAEVGANLTITDLKTEEQLAPVVKKLQSKRYKYPITFHLGKHNQEDFSKAHIVIKNPAVLWNNKYLALAKQIETDLSLFLRFVKNPIIAITGSKGKSTTASALHHILSKCGTNCYLGGNITISPLSFIKEAQKESHSPIILELSSWQLSDINYVEQQSNIKLLHPQISIITNILHDHQNTYNNFSDYVKDKKIVYKNQTTQDYLLTFNDSWGNSFNNEAMATTHLFSINQDKSSILIKSAKQEQLIPCCSLPPTILGWHNKINIGFAIKGAMLLGYSLDEATNAISDFKGMKHRMETIKKFQVDETVVTAVNDSAATMPDALLASTNSYSLPIYLLAGGTDKELDFSPLTQIPSHVKKYILFEGSATSNFLPLLDKEKVVGLFKTMKSAIEAAVNEIKKDRPKEAIILLSPGAASFGLFNNEFDRGDQFRSAIMELS